MGVQFSLSQRVQFRMSVDTPGYGYYRPPPSYSYPRYYGYPGYYGPPGYYGNPG